jgi:hypothetical protein
MGFFHNWTGAWTFALGATVGACTGGTFECAQDPDCGEGQCVAPGFCSFPDSTCESQWAYGQHSGDLSGTCVPVDDVGATLDDDGAGTGPGDGSDFGSSEPPSTTSPISGVDGSDLDGGSSSSTGWSAEESTAASTTDPTSSSEDTGPPPSGLCSGDVLVIEAFDSWPVDGSLWNVYDHENVAPHVVDGALFYDFPPEPSDNAYAGMLSVGHVSAPGGLALEVLAISDPGQPAGFYAMLEAEPLGWGFSFAGEQLEVSTRDGDTWTALLTMPWDPVLHRWVRVRPQSEGAVAWDVSSDAETWTELHSLAVDGALLEQLTGHVGGGAWALPFEAYDVFGFDNLHLCAF